MNKDQFKDVTFLDDLVAIPSLVKTNYRYFKGLSAGVRYLGSKPGSNEAGGDILLFLVRKLGQDYMQIGTFNLPAVQSEQDLVKKAKEFLNNETATTAYLMGYLSLVGLVR
jgi:hypothetical protein